MRKHGPNGTQRVRAHAKGIILEGASGPAAVKPTALDGFLESHPVAKTFLTTQRTPVSYATITYFGVNSFELTNARGESRYVR
jgi:catalase